MIVALGVSMQDRLWWCRLGEHRCKINCGIVAVGVVLVAGRTTIHTSIYVCGVHRWRAGVT